MRPGKAQAARDLDQDTLERHRQIPGQDQPETMASASNLAADLITDGEVRELTHRSAVAALPSPLATPAHLRTQ